jgi:hypothetical protein
MSSALRCGNAIPSPFQGRQSRLTRTKTGSHHQVKAGFSRQLIIRNAQPSSLKLLSSNL